MKLSKKYSDYYFKIMGDETEWGAFISIRKGGGDYDDCIFDTGRGPVTPIGWTEESEQVLAPDNPMTMTQGHAAMLKLGFKPAPAGYFNE